MLVPSAPVIICGYTNTGGVDVNTVAVRDRLIHPKRPSRDQFPSISQLLIQRPDVVRLVSRDQLPERFRVVWWIVWQSSWITT